MSVQRYDSGYGRTLTVPYPERLQLWHAAWQTHLWRCKTARCAQLQLIVCPQGVWQALALPAWRPQSQPLMEALGNRIRSHNLKLLTRSYTAISVSKVAAMLGIPQAAVAEGKPHSHIRAPCSGSSSQMRCAPPSWRQDEHGRQHKQEVACDAVSLR